MDGTCRNRTGVLDVQRLPKMNVPMCCNNMAAAHYTLRCTPLNIVIKRAMHRRHGINCMYSVANRVLYCTRSVNRSEILK